MKIPFDIKFRPQIESGEYKVVTSFGEPAEIVKWDCKGQYPLLACIFDGDTDDAAFYTGEGKGVCNSKENYLFIITPEEELTEFEKKLWEVLKSEGSPIGPIEKFTNADKEVFHSYASKLLALAIDARAREMDEALEKSKLDKDSIPYHLIEFMCNLYTCPNWKEIEETAELYVTRIKAAALKDLPRWRKIKALDVLPCRAYLYNLAYERENNFYGRATIHGLLMPNEAVKVGCDTWYLPVDDIQNLPKED